MSVSWRCRWQSSAVDYHNLHEDIWHQWQSYWNSVNKCERLIKWCVREWVATLSVDGDECTVQARWSSPAPAPMQPLLRRPPALSINMQPLHFIAVLLRQFQVAFSRLQWRRRGKRKWRFSSVFFFFFIVMQIYYFSTYLGVIGTHMIVPMSDDKLWCFITIKYEVERFKVNCHVFNLFFYCDHLGVATFLFYLLI